MKVLVCMRDYQGEKSGDGNVAEQSDEGIAWHCGVWVGTLKS
jgi:hypothetical protein